MFFGNDRLFNYSNSNLLSMITKSNVKLPDAYKCKQIHLKSKIQ